MACRKVVVLNCDYDGDTCLGSRTIDTPTLAEARRIAHEDESWIFHQVNGKPAAWCGKCVQMYQRITKAREA